MPHKILKSVADQHGDFPSKVMEHARLLSAWREHMKKVERDEKNPKLLDIARHVAYPRPIAHLDIERSINDETFRHDFEIIDDSVETAEIRLRQKKETLFGVVSNLENEALERLIPRAKRRYLEIRANEIVTEDMERSHMIASQSPGLSADEVKKSVEKSRDDADARFMDEYNANIKKASAISRAAAKAHHDIEDLTAKNIDAWKPAKFS